MVDEDFSANRNPLWYQGIATTKSKIVACVRRVKRWTAQKTSKDARSRTPARNWGRGETPPADQRTSSCANDGRRGHLRSTARRLRAKIHHLPIFLAIARPVVDGGSFPQPVPRTARLHARHTRDLVVEGELIAECSRGISCPGRAV